MKNFKLHFNLCIILITIYSPISAQVDTTGLAADTVKNWKVAGKSALNFSQVSLTNWAEGGDGSIAGAFVLNADANYKHGRHIWDNSFQFEYGLTKINSESLKKSIDQIYLSSKYGYELRKPWYLSLLFDFKTQLTNGYNYPNDSVYISTFMAPGYINFALGFDYRPSDNLSLMISPVSTKLTFVLDDVLSDAGLFGVDPGEKFRAELGAYLKFKYMRKALLQNVDFETRLDLFSNYFDDPQNIDVNWDVKFNLKINEFLSTTFGTTLKYDNDIKYIDEDGFIHGPRTQLKQFLAVGIFYKFLK